MNLSAIKLKLSVLLIAFTLALAFVPDKADAQISGYNIDTIGASANLTHYQIGNSFQANAKMKRQGDFEYVAQSDSLSGGTNVTIKIQFSKYGDLWVTDTTFTCNGNTSQTFTLTRRGLLDLYWREVITSPGGAQATKVQREWIYKEDD
jgi:hypothetical protein